MGLLGAQVIDLAAAPDDDILARTICGEARGEGQQGMEDVACTIMNRVAKPSWWGSTVKGVCLKPYQYSCWLLGDPNRAIILSLDDCYSIYREALDIARRAIAGELPDRTLGSTHYRRTGTPARWAAAHTPVYTSGHHEFFNDIP
jgi:N-acetylmuramoyl-L-alanine amidase